MILSQLKKLIMSIQQATLSVPTVNDPICFKLVQPGGYKYITQQKPNKLIVALLYRAH